jgi:hypothetical protein
MKNGLHALCAFLLLILSILPVHAESLVLYDNFNSGEINPDKWVGYESNNNAAREVVRQIRNGRLNLSTCSYGSTGSNIGGQAGGPYLRFNNPGLVKAIQAIVQVNKCEIAKCAGNDTVGKAKARLRGCFFNTNAAVPGSTIHDVCADITITRTTDSMEPSDVLHIVGNVWECLDANCNTSDVLGSKDLGVISLGQKANLLIKWDKENHRFIFRRDQKSKVVPYTASDEIPPSADRKQLDIYYLVSNCVGMTLPKVKMEAFFDNVYVNETAGIGSLSQ